MVKLRHLISETVGKEEPFKVGLDPGEESSDVPINWDEPDLQMLCKWDIPTIRKFLGLPKSYVAIYRTIIDVNELDAHVGDDDSGEDTYDYDEFRYIKRGLPPIVIRRTNGRLFMVDGNHRVYWAQHHTKYQTIGAWVVDDDIQKKIQ